MKKLLLSAIAIGLLLVTNVYAHCPLCTVGAAAAATGAAWFGVDKIIIGIFTGAFAVSLGWWISRMLKKQYIPYQRTTLILLSFATTILPLLKIMEGFSSIYISLAGDYGSLLNRTYLINKFLMGSIFGGVIVSLTPWLSGRITKLRAGKMIPFQGIILTLSLLVILSVIIQFM